MTLRGLLLTVFLSPAFLLAWIQPAAAQVVFDAATSPAGATAVTSCSFSHTVGAGGTNRLIILAATNGTGSATATSATYATVDMGAAVGTVQNADGITRSTIFKLVAPATGANTAVVNMSASTSLVCGAISFTGVDQTTPVGTYASATGSSAAPSVNVSSATNDIVVDAVALNAQISNLAVGAGQTQTFKSDNFDTFGGAGSREAGAATVTMSWTSANAAWAIGGVSVKQVSGAAASAVSDEDNFEDDSVIPWPQRLRQ